jgi:hypothetical protein
VLILVEGRGALLAANRDLLDSERGARYPGLASRDVDRRQL